METLRITSKQPFAMRDVGKILSAKWRIEDSPGNTLVVHSAQSRAYLYQAEEFETKKEFHLLIDYSDVALAKSLLEWLADDPAVTVDNDFGTVLPGDQFVALCKSDSDWDWRR